MLMEKYLPWSDPVATAAWPGGPECQARLDAQSTRRLAEAKDESLPAAEYIRRWNYKVDAIGTAPDSP